MNARASKRSSRRNTRAVKELGFIVERIRAPNPVILDDKQFERVVKLTGFGPDVRWALDRILHAVRNFRLEVHHKPLSDIKRILGSASKHNIDLRRELGELCGYPYQIELAAPGFDLELLKRTLNALSEWERYSRQMLERITSVQLNALINISLVHKLAVIIKLQTGKDVSRSSNRDEVNLRKFLEDMLSLSYPPEIIEPERSGLISAIRETMPRLRVDPAYQKLHPDIADDDPAVDEVFRRMGDDAIARSRVPKRGGSKIRRSKKF